MEFTGSSHGVVVNKKCAKKAEKIEQFWTVYALYQFRSAYERVKSRFASALDSFVSAMLVLHCEGEKGKLIQQTQYPPSS